MLGAGAGLDALIRDIDYLASPLPLALTQAAREAGAAAELFTLAAESLRGGDGLTAGEAWQAALAECGPEDSLRLLLAPVAAGLGETDAKCQLRQLQACRQQVERGREQAAEAYARFGKLWRAMGWCGGAVIILLLI